MPPPSRRPSSLATASNLLTVSRLVLLPLVLIALARGAVWWAVGLMVLAYLTDLADGRLARRLHQAGVTGRTLDTAVDFIFIYGLFIAFYFAGRIPTYQFAVLYLVKLGTLAVQYLRLNPSQPRDLPATPLRKLAGAFGYAYVLVVMLRLVAPADPSLTLAQIVIFALLTLTMLLNAAECWTRPCRSPA